MHWLDKSSIFIANVILQSFGMVELSRRMVNRLISEFSLVLICAFVLYNNDKLRKTTKRNKKKYTKGGKLEILTHLIHHSPRYIHIKTYITHRKLYKVIFILTIIVYDEIKSPFQCLWHLLLD